MTKTASKHSIPFVEFVETVQIEPSMASITQQLDQLHRDIQFIKSFFLAKEEKKQRRRQRKEQKRLDRQQELKSRGRRQIYETMAWEISHRPWKFMPFPSSKLSPKDLHLVSLLALNRSDKQIARRMHIKENSIRPRVCAARKKVGASNQQDLVGYYQNYQKQRREHRHRRCLILLSWLLNPPPGTIARYNMDLTWKRTVGKSRKFYYVGLYIPRRVFDSFREFEHSVLKLKIRGLNNKTIAARLGIKETTVQTYFSDMRSSVMWATGTAAMTDDLLVSSYKKYLSQ